MEHHFESNELPLRWLLSQKALELLSINQQSSSFRVVQATELTDPSPFLSDKAIVLTVGLGFEGNADGFGDYVRTLKKAGVAAIGFGTGLIFDTVPTQLIDGARAEDMALFEVPHDTAFLSITEAVNREFSKRESLMQEELSRKQRNATQAAITGGIDALIELASRDLGCAVAIIDNDDRVVARANRDGLDATVAPDHAQHHIHHRMLSFGERFHSFVTLSNSSLTPLDRQYIKHVAGLADLLLQRPLSLRRARASLNSLALSVLLGLDAQPQHLTRAFSRIADSRGMIRPVIIHTNVDKQSARLLNGIDEALSKSDRELCALSLDSKTTLVFFRGSRTPEEIMELVGARREFARIAIGAALEWENIDATIVDALVTTAKSLPLGHFLDPESSPLKWIHDAAVRQALDHRARETLSKLADYDRAHHNDLVQTLVTYLHSGANAKATAATLGVHRHTIRGKLTKIEEICEVDLGDPVTRAELLIVAVSRHAHEKPTQN